MIKANIDGKIVQVEPETTVLQAARKAGCFIPSLCNHELLEPYGACRVCSVEIEETGRKKVVTACNYPIRRELSVFTESERTQKTRKMVLEMLLSRWPNVKAVRDMAKHAGVERPRFDHPQRDDDEHACILCGACVRMCREGVWQDVLGFEGRGPSRKVTMPFGKQSPVCVSCGACAAVCPTGAIQMVDDPNGPADWKRIRKAGLAVTGELIKMDRDQMNMRERGTTNLVHIMNDYDLLPVNNYKYGSHPDSKKITAPVFTSKYFNTRLQDGCALGCDMACAHSADDFVLQTGPDKGRSVSADGPEYETLGGSTNMGIYDPAWIIEMNYYCDTYGIDTISYCTAMAFVMECYEAGVLNEERTGGLKLPFGAQDDAMELLHQMGRGDGFGVVVGQGIRRMKKIFAEEHGADPAFLQDIGMEAKGLEYSEYVTKESLAQQGGYGAALKGPQHDEAWLIFMDQVNKQLPTFKDQADALHYMPMWRTWFGLNGLCKLPWNDIVPEKNAEADEPHKVPSHVAGYCDFFAGVTGREVTPDDLIAMSERVYNFQRVFNLKMGFGRREHDQIPYRSVGPVTAEEYESRQERYDTQLKNEIGYDPTGKSTADKMAVLRQWREDRYQKLLDAVYARRGWTNDGVPTLAKVRDLGIDKVDDLIDLLQRSGVNE